MQAVNMVQMGRMSHDGADGSTVGDRMRDAGLKWCFVAENVAWGQQSAEQVVTGWMNSEGHRRNILSEATVIGTARQGGYWAATFARPCR